MCVLTALAFLQILYISSVVQKTTSFQQLIELIEKEIHGVKKAY